MSAGDADEKPAKASELPKDPEAAVRSWGFGHVFTWIDGPYVAR
jgi:hypothetical protein